MRRELRNQIAAQARSLLDSGAVANRREALTLADDLVRCGARAKSTGRPCQCRPVPGKRRCRLHGGLTPKARLKLFENSPDRESSQIPQWSES